jgi:hypothetical protein
VLISSILRAAQAHGSNNAAGSEERGVLHQAIYGPRALYESGRISALSSQLEAGLKARSQRLPRALPGAAPVESPLQRYTRLAEEVGSLHNELSAVAGVDAAAGASAATSDGNVDDVWSRLRQGTESLQRQLASLPPLFAAGQLGARTINATSVPLGEAGPASWYEAALARLAQVREEALQPEKKDGYEAEGAHDTRGAGGTADQDKRDGLLEARRAALESLLIGHPLARDNTPTAAAGPTEHAAGEAKNASGLAARLDALSAAVSLMQPPVLKEVTARAEEASAALKQLQHQAASHGILGSPPASASVQATTGGHGGFVMTSERASRAVQTLEHCESAVAALPVLASRLVSLDGLHRDAALFTQRLALAEAAVSATDARLARSEALLTELREGLQHAAAAMAHNVNELQGAFQQQGSK